MFALLTLLLSASPSPYRPYPIILIHGINSNAGTWGFEIDSVDTANGVDYPVVLDTLIGEHTSLALWNLLHPYFYLAEQDTLQGLRTFLASLNFDDFGGSIDPGDYDSDDTVRYWYAEITPQGDTAFREVIVTLHDKGSGAELKHLIWSIAFRGMPEFMTDVDVSYIKHQGSDLCSLHANRRKRP